MKIHVFGSKIVWTSPRSGHRRPKSLNKVSCVFSFYLFLDKKQSCDIQEKKIDLGDEISFDFVAQWPQAPTSSNKGVLRQNVYSLAKHECFLIGKAADCFLRTHDGLCSLRIFVYFFLLYRGGRRYVAGRYVGTCPPMAWAKTWILTGQRVRRCG